MRNSPSNPLDHRFLDPVTVDPFVSQQTGNGGGIAALEPLDSATQEDRTDDISK